MEHIGGIAITGLLATGIAYWTLKGFYKEASHIKHGCCGSGNSGCAGCSNNCNCGLAEAQEKDSSK